jgi:hypothetical protein
MSGLVQVVIDVKDSLKTQRQEEELRERETNKAICRFCVCTLEC